MKQTIHLGAYGWRHKHWLKSFYPPDLPVADGEDWRLSYYSNEFDVVLVPVDYWQAGQVNDCADWLDSVHEGFQFFVECHSRMFDSISMVDLTDALENLKPQLSALVFLNDKQRMPDEIKNQFIELADTLAVEVIDAVSSVTCFVFIDDELLDLRAARTIIEPFVVQLNDTGIKDAAASIIVNHPQLQADNLAKFRAVLEIMGC